MTRPAAASELTMLCRCSCAADLSGHAACLHSSLPGAALTPEVPAGTLPLELLVTLLSLLPPQAIAVCALVSRHWRAAAAQAVP